MDALVDIYLTSIWKYEDAGIERVLTELRKQNPEGRFDFEPENGWFKATCLASKISDVQAGFRKVHAEIESELQTRGDTSKMPFDSKWLKVPTPRELLIQPESTKRPAVDYQCPVRFDSYDFTQVWRRVKEETPDGVKIHTFLSMQDMAAISESSGVFIQCDPTDRLVYLGGSSKQSLSQASTMLDNMFQRYAYVVPQPKHFLYAETEGMHQVDVRYIAHVNEAMLTSTILDPGQYPGTKMNTMFQAIFSKAVCLRICLFDQFKRIEVSFFGPKAKPLFHSQAHKSPAWFKNEAYALRDLGVSAPTPKELLPTGEPTGEPKTPASPYEIHGLGKDVDIFSLENKFSEMKAETLEAQPASKPIPPPPPPEDDKYSYQLRLLWKFVNSPAPTPKKQERPLKDGHGGGHASRYEASEIDKLITTLDDDIEENKLVDIPSEPPTKKPELHIQEEHQLIELPINKATLISTNGKISNFGSCFSPTLSRKLCRQIGLLIADLPYRRGRIRVQAQLGRIYMMDANPSGLATNGPGERASGWDPTDIVTRLDAVCVSPGSVMFTKALTIFANDIESVIETGTPEPTWNFHESRVIYEFKCQRFFFTDDGASGAHRPFVVEIDGTKPGEFTYNLRRLDDARSPIWLHCIRRHWDARIAVLYSPTEKLEKTYGDFARELLQSMVVLPGPIGSGAGPRFQVSYDHREVAREEEGGMLAAARQKFCTKVLSARVRHVGRHVSGDGESFLDVSWNRHMKLETRPGNSDGRTGVLRATAAPDEPVKGVFGSWYEASVLSVRAEEAFRENETLEVGGAAAWASQAAQEDMFRAMFIPALGLVEKMDGVGVLVDNGQGETMWTPPTGQMAMTVVPASGRFW